MSHLIYVAAKLELTDRLKHGPRTVEQLATAAEVQARHSPPTQKFSARGLFDTNLQTQLDPT